MACKRPTNMGNAVAKHDLVAGTTKMWHEEGATAGEGFDSRDPFPGQGPAPGHCTGGQFLLMLFRDLQACKKEKHSALRNCWAQRFMPSWFVEKTDVKTGSARLAGTSECVLTCGCAPGKKHILPWHNTAWQLSPNSPLFHQGSVSQKTSSCLVLLIGVHFALK